MRHNKVITGLVVALAAGLLATSAGMVGVAAVSAAMARRGLAAAAPAVGIGLGSAVFAGAHVLYYRRDGHRIGPSLLAGVVLAGTTVTAVGPENLSLMSTGVAASCEIGLGRCLPTKVPAMPLMLRLGPVQHRPVIHLVVWGANGQAAGIADRAESHAASLGQPLLQRSYGVRRAVDGGAWRVPGHPRAWLASRHEKSLSPADLAAVIRRARAATGWADTPDTQWWVLAGLTARQMGLAPRSCADHLHVPGVEGVVVRLPVDSCRLPAAPLPPSPGNPCSPVAELQPTAPEPSSVQAGLQLTIGHEFAEAATDPTDGWRVLVAPECHGFLTLEIADVCAPDGQIISAPSYDTKAGWQPSLLQPPGGGRPARCVDPARPGRRPAVSDPGGRVPVGHGTARSP